MYCMYSARNLADFAKLIASQTLDDNKSCVPFDVVSLFNIVPTDLAIQVACQHFSKWPFPSRTHSLTTADIPHLLEFCLNATYFAFRYSLYQQVHGTAMSSLVSVVVAELVTSRWLGLQTVPSLERCREAFMERFHSIYIRTWSHTKSYFCKQYRGALGTPESHCPVTRPSVYT